MAQNDRPRPRLVVEQRGPSRVALVMRTGLTEAHDRVLGELPAKLRPAFEVAATLAVAGVPSERWNDVVTAGITLVARDPKLCHLLGPRQGGET